MKLRQRFYRATDDGAFSCGSTSLAHLKRVQARHRRMGFDSPYKHIVEVVPTPHAADPFALAVLRLVPQDPNPQQEVNP